MTSEINKLTEAISNGDRRALARAISIVENDLEGYAELLEQLSLQQQTPVIGITGPPGAGKSSLVNALVRELVKEGPVAVLAVDPTSPFTHGSLLGDRLRMNEHYNNPNVYIRSLATRGALGGLSSKTVEITDLLRASGFRYILIETVGVGQSEVEIAGLADTTVVVFVPESGDEIQTIKSGIMEIADIFVVNKSDRDGAAKLVKTLTTTLHERPHTQWQVPVLKTIAISSDGVPELIDAIKSHAAFPADQEHKKSLLFQKAGRIVQGYLARKIDQSRLEQSIDKAYNQPGFNIYRFVRQFLSETP